MADILGSIILLILGLIFLILIAGLVYSIFIITVSFRRNKLLGLILASILLICIFIGLNGNIGPFLFFVMLLSAYGLLLLIRLVYTICVKKLKKKVKS
ncbi:Uncharacterised protein [Candidatus Tiddalikarchaeum anstoanum]|nr:Uncharacterised protein [Candidatus Tiddalikarchaeum anstoanum]